jgi:hypothetical protein
MAMVAVTVADIHQLDPAVAFIEIDELCRKKFLVGFPDVGIRGVAFDEDDALSVRDQIIENGDRHHRFADAPFTPPDPIDSRSVDFDAAGLIHD